jgi:hypothetical protein
VLGAQETGWVMRWTEEGKESHVNTTTKRGPCFDWPFPFLFLSFHSFFLPFFPLLFSLSTHNILHIVRTFEQAQKLSQTCACVGQREIHLHKATFEKHVAKRLVPKQSAKVALGQKL